MTETNRRWLHSITGFTIAGKILFANCAIVAVGAFSGTWITQQYEQEPVFLMGAIFFTGGLLLCLPINYLAAKVALAPLDKLADTMKEVQQENNLYAAVELDGQADPQIRMLSSSFNTMLQWIRDDRDTIEKLSLIDPLTDVGNTRALHNGLEAEIARIQRYGQDFPTFFSLLIIDLDNFKMLNDTFGHLSGDTVLRDMAELLKTCLRKTDTTLAALKHYRFGGDEFVIIAPHTSRDGARILAERLDCIIARHRFLTRDGIPISETSLGPLRASIGYASYPEETTSADELLSLADKRMYAVKENRKRKRLVSPPRPGDYNLRLGRSPNP
ncbi:phytochrome-like protein cph2 [bacterium BMS3Abin01]|nr:phytochrome-like protein cph2 [bacterium BMS3Abin01]